jgi:hypothetical protein
MYNNKQLRLLHYSSPITVRTSLQAKHNGSVIGLWPLETEITCSYATRDMHVILLVIPVCVLLNKYKLATDLSPVIPNAYKKKWFTFQNLILNENP